jgi:hypothetical protein
VGFNRKKKGQRSYYPLFCSVAQTGQVLDVWHRPGNVHDSNGAKAFTGGPLSLDRNWKRISVFLHHRHSLLERRHEKKAS